MKFSFERSVWSYIFTEHCLEHISLRDCLFVLSECRRVLRPGAYLRIVVPDLEIYIQQYVGHRPMPYADDDLVDDLYSPAMSINRIMRAHGHQFIYDFLTLQKLLTAVGFIEVKKCSFGESSDPGLALDTPERKTESLYVEARRQTIPV
jgi:predicted SAM-dependent methyltransferase